MRVAWFIPLVASVVCTGAACGARLAASDGADASVRAEDASVGSDDVHRDAETTSEATTDGGDEHDGGDSCHPGVCVENACTCTSDRECCSGSCREGFCVGMLFCGAWQCFSPYDYCQTSGGPDAGSTQFGYECRKLPADCIGNWTCDCVMATNPCGSGDAAVTCDDHEPGNVFVHCP